MPTNNIIRVFPKRTSFTPVDEDVFIGYPPLFRPKYGHEIHISCSFTWDIDYCWKLYKAWEAHYGWPWVKIGGPAMGSSPSFEGYNSGMYVKPNILFTSYGCNKNCSYCLVPIREGKLKERENYRLPALKDDPNIQDNNLLQCSKKHLTIVFNSLRRFAKPITFGGGLDIDYLDDCWIIDQLRTLRIKQLFISCDTKSKLKNMLYIRDKLSFIPTNKLRCYVLIGFNNETINEASERLQKVYNCGFLPFAQLYQPPDKKKKKYDQNWKKLNRFWSRPAIMKSKFRVV